MTTPTLDWENSLWQKGLKFVCGIDEVGRGSWAGPLVAAGVVLPQNFILPKYLRDSKLLSAQKREEVSKIIQREAISIGISQISPNQIDKLGLTKSTGIVFRKVIKSLNVIPDYCLIDAFPIGHYSKKKQSAIIHGDALCASIAAASIIAKVYRDNLMKTIHYKHPLYGFQKHKGYGTKIHQEAIKNYGLLKIHRKSYNLSLSS